MRDATVSAAGMRIVKLLVGKPAETVADLVDASGVTRTAVTEQLNGLLATGLVERTTKRMPGRGRPRNLYKTTDATLLLLFANNQRLVVPVIWHVIDQIGGEELIGQVLQRVSRALADHYRRRLTAVTPQGRFRQMGGLFREEGAVVDAYEQNDQLVLNKRTCSFISMFEDSRVVCLIDQEMMSKIVGAPVRRTACRHDGDPCCVFTLPLSDVDSSG